ncbi:MAG TPA: inositol monophosphatase family protein [Candidatus Saccharimonas sp.]|nr:inositol monophosphatase family protein [Candidatus Saccharimonas sp.]
MQSYLHFAKTLATDAGDIVLRHFTNVAQHTTQKTDLTELTTADEAINQLVLDRISAAYPDHAVLAEEGSRRQQSDYTWVCDPIDGTFMYAHGLPMATFNLALTHNGEVQVAVCYDPFLKRMFTASRGNGAFLNDQPLNLHDRIIAGRIGVELEVWGGASSSIFKDVDLELTIRAALTDRADWVLLYWPSIAYSSAMVAKGDLGAVVFAGKNPWDGAAVSLIAQEAGAIVTDIFGNKGQRFDQETKGFIIAHPTLYGKLFAKVQPVVASAELV